MRFVHVHISVPLSTPPPQAQIQFNQNAVIFCCVTMFRALNLALSFFVPGVDDVAFKSVNMVTTEQQNVMTDSASVDS